MPLIYPVPSSASHSLFSAYFRCSLGNSSEDVGVLVLYLIHSVFLDSILATKALSIICRTESSESHNRGLKYWEWVGRRSSERNTRS